MNIRRFSQSLFQDKHDATCDDDDSCSRLYEYLKKRHKPCCTEEEIQALEEQFNVCLPDDYRLFLKYAGKGSRNYWVGSDFDWSLLIQMQEWGKELLEENGKTLPEGSFVFFMHQGYQLFFFQKEQGVFFYLEEEPEKEREYDSFSDFFFQTKDT